MAISFTVTGQSQPAGSKRAFPFHKRDGSLGVSVSDDNPKSKGWKELVAFYARQAYDGPLLDGPLSVTFVFYRPRPKGHFNTKGALNKKGRDSSAPTTKPDVLKLARGVEDAISGIIWRDDAIIVDEFLSKRYGEPARCEITIEEIVDQGELFS